MNTLSNTLFLGKVTEDLGQLIAKQCEEIFKQKGIVIPVKSCSTIAAINTSQEASLSDISKFLGQSHQLVKQKIEKLKSLDLISSTNDPLDKRRIVYSMTSKGKDQLELLTQITPTLVSVYGELHNELGINLKGKIEEAMELLELNSLSSRFNSFRQKNHM